MRRKRLTFSPLLQIKRINRLPVILQIHHCGYPLNKINTRTFAASVIPGRQRILCGPGRNQKQAQACAQQETRRHTSERLETKTVQWALPFSQLLWGCQPCGADRTAIRSNLTCIKPLTARIENNNQASRQRNTVCPSPILSVSSSTTRPAC